MPLCTPGDVARYLHMPVWSALALAGWDRFPPDPEWFFHHFFRRCPPFLECEEPDLSRFPDEVRRISFRRFAELFVRAAVARDLLERLRLDATETPRRKAVYDTVWRAFGRPHDAVFLEGASTEEAVARLTAAYTDSPEDVCAERAKKSLVLCLDRVELEDGIPHRLYPFSRVPADQSPRTVVMDPRIRFGRPAVVGCGIPTDSLFDRHQAGDSIAELAADYGV